MLIISKRKVNAFIIIIFIIIIIINIKIIIIIIIILIIIIIIDLHYPIYIIKGRGLCLHNSPQGDQESTESLATKQEIG